MIAAAEMSLIDRGIIKQSLNIRKVKQILTETLLRLTLILKHVTSGPQISRLTS